MLDLEKLFLEEDIKTDELGRIVIEDEALLDKINGAVLSMGEFPLTDGACGNSNCLC